MKRPLLDPAADRTLVTTRIVNATQELVFKAWTDPAHLKNWWGPRGFTNTFEVFDLQPGGKWIFTMHGPDDSNYPNESIFVQIDAPSFVAWDHISQHFFQVQASFEKISDSQTKVTFSMVFTTPEECARVKAFAAEKNEENMDKLEEEIGKMKK